MSEEFLESIAEAIRSSEVQRGKLAPGDRPESIDLLTLSGGADDGAYGAGLLYGWSERGDRPSFQLVTGISTGALIAPLAFLGPSYDEVLRDAYTTIDLHDVARSRWLLNAIFQDGLADTDPLGELIQKWITEDVLARIAEEHAKGRRLLIQTVNLEAQRPVIWDMGAIASSGHPKAVSLFRQIMLASASVPAAFEPQYIEVSVGEERFEEMHVDGGAAMQIFLWGFGVTVADLNRRVGAVGPPVPVRLWVIRNGRLEPQHAEMDGRFLGITARALATMIKAQGAGDVARLALMARANGMQFQLTSIPPEFEVSAEGLFDPTYMNALFDFGRDRILSEDPWEASLPLLEASGLAAPGES